MSPKTGARGHSRLAQAASVVVALFTVAFATAGCSSTSTSPDAAESGVNRSAANLDSRLCVTNSSSSTVQVTWTYADVADALPNNLLTAQATTCASGDNEGAFALSARVRWNDKLSQLFSVYHPTLGSAEVVIDGDRQSATTATRCQHTVSYFGVKFCGDAFDEGTSKTYVAYDFHQSVLKRITDSADHVEFTLDLLK